MRALNISKESKSFELYFCKCWRTHNRRWMFYKYYDIFAWKDFMIDGNDFNNLYMNNQDILLPASLQSFFPQLSQIPSQISDVLNGEKLDFFQWLNYEIYYILCFFTSSIRYVLYVSLTYIASFMKYFFKFVWAFFIWCWVSFFQVIVMVSANSIQLQILVIICMSNWVIEIRTFECILPLFIMDSYIHILFQKISIFSR